MPAPTKRSRSISPEPRRPSTYHGSFNIGPWLKLQIFLAFDNNLRGTIVAAYNPKRVITGYVYHSLDVSPAFKESLKLTLEQRPNLEKQSVAVCQAEFRELFVQLAMARNATFQGAQDPFEVVKGETTRIGATVPIHLGFKCASRGVCRFLDALTVVEYHSMVREYLEDQQLHWSKPLPTLMAAASRVAGARLTLTPTQPPVPPVPSPRPNASRVETVQDLRALIPKEVATTVVNANLSDSEPESDEKSDDLPAQQPMLPLKQMPDDMIQRVAGRIIKLVAEAEKLYELELQMHMYNPIVLPRAMLSALVHDICTRVAVESVDATVFNQVAESTRLIELCRFCPEEKKGDFEQMLEFSAPPASAQLAQKMEKADSDAASNCHMLCSIMAELEVQMPGEGFRCPAYKTMADTMRTLAVLLTEQSD